MSTDKHVCHREDVAILAPPEGRALPGGLQEWPPSRSGCDPRPSRRKGAAPSAETSSASKARLRSSPLPKEGRCRRSTSPDQPPLIVAILAPPEGRALPGTPTSYRRIIQCCDPRPSRRKGAADHGPAARCHLYVAILAPPEGRALPYLTRSLKGASTVSTASLWRGLTATGTASSESPAVGQARLRFLITKSPRPQSAHLAACQWSRLRLALLV